MRVLLLNGAKEFSSSKGRLNTTLHETARDTFKELGWSVRETRIDSGYDVQHEITNYVWADLVVYQFPAWWLGTPWHVKRYVDEVLQEGYGELWEVGPGIPWGEGGHLGGRKFMVSMTWSAPETVFDEPSSFLEGKGIDDVLLPFHKTNEFLGMARVPTFMVNDVIENPDPQYAVRRYREHILANFS